MKWGMKKTCKGCQLEGEGVCGDKGEEGLYSS